MKQDVIEITDSAAKKLGSLSAVARALGTTPQHLHKWRTGEETCPAHVRAAIAEIAGLDARQAALDEVLVRAKGKPYYAALVRALGKSLAGVAIMLSSMLTQDATKNANLSHGNV